MEDTGKRNPYPEDEPRLHRSWEDGYWTAKSARPIGEIQLPDFFDPIIQAFREGHRAGLDQNEQA